ncbi:hypothetical protein AGMMS49992_27350 [Clostridia bacterium]|nr:hypothetical protein AGMMS49992_27350 [Clostridia bacterium]
MKYLIGVDEGTTGCRACLFDENGNIISSHAREYSSYFPKPGYVEQDIDEIKESVFSSIREAIEHSGVNTYDIVGISHSNQGITMVLLDEYDNPAREKTIGWQDVRHTEILSELRKLISDDEYYHIAGMGLGTYNIPIINWLRKYESNTWQRVKRLCSHQDYFLHEYGAGGYYIDEGSANFMSMVDVHNNEYNNRLLDLYEVQQNQLPMVIHEPGKVVGYVTDEISGQTSLPSGCSISLGGLDTNCSSFAAGADEAGKMVLIVGTAGVSILITDRFSTDPDKRITIRSNPGFGNYQQYIMTNTAASSFRWFRDELCSMEVATSRLVGCDPYDLMTSMASLSKPGAKGVTALTCL